MRGSRRGGGGRGSGPPWKLKILPKKKKVISGFFWGLDPPPSSVIKNYHFRWTPSHENFWIRQFTPELTVPVVDASLP